MKTLILVMLGGAVGSGLRYLLSTSLLPTAVDWRFPLGTLAVNWVGCFAAGLLAGWAETRGWFDSKTASLVFVGLLGGFTTFSAFGLDALQLFRRHEPGTASVYIGATVGIGLLLTYLGFRITGP